MSCGLITPPVLGHAVLIDLLHDLRHVGGRRVVHRNRPRPGFGLHVFRTGLLIEDSVQLLDRRHIGRLGVHDQRVQSSVGHDIDAARREATAAATATQQQITHQAAADVAQRIARQVADDAAVFAAATAAEDRVEHFGNRRGLGILQIENGVLAAGRRVVTGDRGEQVFQLIERFEVVRGNERATRPRRDDDRRPRFGS